jgi:hypothetical protein
MLDLALNNLIAIVAERVATSVDDAAASHDAMRAKRADYRTRLQQAALPLLGAISDELTDAVQQRYADWLSNPRLGHGALIDEGRLSDNSLQQAIVDYQARPSLAYGLALVLALVRVIAITRVIGADCLYLEPTRRSKKRAPVGTDRRKSRRSIQLSDIPDTVHPIVAKLSPGDPDRASAVAQLKDLAKKGAPGSVVVAKLLYRRARARRERQHRWRAC